MKLPRVYYFSTIVLICSFIRICVCTEPSITKIVIPAAGLGTRFLPFTKSVPKEMLPIMDKPAIHAIVHEGLQAGIKEFCIITNDSKNSIFHYLSHQLAYEAKLKDAGKDHLDSINDIIDSASFTHVSQPQPLGTGHATLLTKDIIGNEYFGLMFPDEIFLTEISVIKQLITIAKKYNATVIGVREVPKEKVSRYGIITIKKMIAPDIFEITDIIEKPSPEQAPSNLATCGRYIFSPKIFDVLQHLKPGYGGEIQLTDGIGELIKKGGPVLAVKIPAPHDIGNPLGWISANITYAMKDPRYTASIKSLFKNLLANN